MLTILASLGVFCNGLVQITQTTYKGQYYVDKSLIITGICICILQAIGAAELFGIIQREVKRDVLEIEEWTFHRIRCNIYTYDFFLLMILFSIQMIV